MIAVHLCSSEIEYEETLTGSTFVGPTDIGTLMACALHSPLVATILVDLHQIGISMPSFKDLTSLTRPSTNTPFAPSLEILIAIMPPMVAVRAPFG